MSTILFHSSPLVFQLGLHNAENPGGANAQNINDEPAVDPARPAVPRVPLVMVRRVADRRRRTDDIRQSA